MPRRTAAAPAAKSTVVSAPLIVIRALDPNSLVDVGNGEYTIIVGACGLKRQDGTPSQAGDVLSVQENGTLQTRPAGTSGNFERCCRTLAGAVYRPIGAGGIVVILPLAQDVPNK
jgi:hypothetical protein